MNVLNNFEFVNLEVQCIQIHCYFENVENMIFPLLCCFPTLTSKCPKGRFVALRFILSSYEPRHQKTWFLLIRNQSISNDQPLFAPLFS